LRIKGETIEEITGCAKVMRAKADKICPNVDYYIDTCGTGGDGTNTFNISTATAFVQQREAYMWQNTEQIGIKQERKCGCFGSFGRQY